MGTNDKACEDCEGEGDGVNFDVELDNAAPCRVAESLPGITHGHVSLATDDSRLDGTFEGAVEGNDGLGVLGQK